MKISIVVVSIFFSLSAFACNTCIGEKENQPFIATSGIPFPELMKTSMHLMDTKMEEVNTKQSNERVFLEMMIAHHQGALDMANSILVHSTNPTIQNYAKTIIAAQYNEIQYMKTLLNKLK